MSIETPSTTSSAAPAATMTVGELRNDLGLLEQSLTIREARDFLYDIDTPQADRLRGQLYSCSEQDEVTVRKLRALLHEPLLQADRYVAPLLGLL